MRWLTEQTILITGATDGLGKALAAELADRGGTLLQGATTHAVTGDTWGCQAGHGHGADHRAPRKFLLCGRR